MGCRKADDARNPLAKRAYYQCLIAGDQLFQKGDKSNRSQAFYKLLLRDPAKAEAKLKAQECEKLVSAAERSVKLDALEAAPKRPRLELPPVPREGVEDEEEVFVGGREEAAAPTPAFSPGVVSEGEPSSSSSSPSSGEEEEVYTGDRPDAPPCPEMMQGVRARPRFKTTTRKWGIEVTCPHHANCRRFRTLDLHTDVFGHRAAELYLALWLTTPIVDSPVGPTFVRIRRWRLLSQSSLALQNSTPLVAILAQVFLVVICETLLFLLFFCFGAIGLFLLHA